MGFFFRFFDGETKAAGAGILIPKKKLSAPIPSRR